MAHKISMITYGAYRKDMFFKTDITGCKETEINNISVQLYLSSNESAVFLKNSLCLWIFIEEQKSMIYQCTFIAAFYFSLCFIEPRLWKWTGIAFAPLKFLISVEQHVWTLTYTS
jgi:hypothetical protein